MDNDVLLKRVNTGSRIAFEEPGLVCLVLKGRINISSPGLRQEMGPGGVIDASTYAYASENSELLFVTMEKLRKIKPDIAARITNGMKVEASGYRSPKQERTAYTYSVDAQSGGPCRTHTRS